jgi:hypothetical protein
MIDEIKAIKKKLGLVEEPISRRGRLGGSVNSSKSKKRVSFYLDAEQKKRDGSVKVSLNNQLK